MSLKTSMKTLTLDFETSAKITTEISTALAFSQEKHWVHRSKETFTAPKGTNFRVKQYQVDFTSFLPKDSLGF